MYQGWETDLKENTGKSGLLACLSSFIMVPSYSCLIWIRIMLASQRKDSRISRLFARMVSLHLIKTYGLHISVLTKHVGLGLRMPHPVGIVIGDGTIIGDHVMILQNVTLGRKDISLPGTPIIRNGVSILAGAVVLGSVELGEHSTVGANAVVVKNVEAGTVVVGVPAKPLMKAVS